MEIGKGRLAAYWSTTALAAFVLLSGGVADLMHWKGTLEVVADLGYPLFFLNIIGFWKVLGGFALLTPGFPRLKEWAYAGAFFELSGAAFSHIFHGDDAAHIVRPLILAAIVVASWALRPPSRVVGVLFPAR